MIPPELSQLALEAFQKTMKGKLHTKTEGNPWHYVQDLQKATDAVCEVTMRWLQEKQNGKTNCGDNGDHVCNCMRTERTTS